MQFRSKWLNTVNVNKKCIIWIRFNICFWFEQVLSHMFSIRCQKVFTIAQFSFMVLFLTKHEWPLLQVITTDSVSYCIHTLSSPYCHFYQNFRLACPRTTLSPSSARESGHSSSKHEWSKWRGRAKWKEEVVKRTLCSSHITINLSKFTMSCL